MPLKESAVNLSKGAHEIWRDEDLVVDSMAKEAQ
jgi:hypothetical protein